MNFNQKHRLRKTFIPTFLMLFLVSNLLAQKVYTKGYITTKSDETILVDLHIPISGKIYTKKDGGKTIRYQRMKLKDYGYIINDKKNSLFAATAFPSRAYDGYFINLKGDTINSYITGSSFNRVFLYTKDLMTKMKLTPEEASGFCIKKGDGYEKYETIDFSFKADVPLGFFSSQADSKLEQKRFAKVISKGKTVLYETTSIIPHVNAIGPNYSELPVYVLMVNEATYSIEKAIFFGKAKEKQAQELLDKLKTILSDYPELFKGIDRTTFNKNDIPKLVEQYNNHFANQYE